MGLFKEILRTVLDYSDKNTESKHGTFTPNAFHSGDLAKTWSPIIGSGLLDLPASQNYYRSFARACINRKAMNLSKGQIYIYRQFKSKKTEIKEHPFISLMNTQNSYGQSFKEMLYISEVNLALHGTAYLKVNSIQTGLTALGNKGKTPVELIPIAAKYVTPIYNKANTAVQYYRYGSENILPEDIIRFKIPDPDNNLEGNAPVKSFNFTLDLEYLMSRSRRMFFKNNARPTLAIEMPGELDEDSADLKRENLDKNHAGVDNDGRIIIVENGAKVQALNTASRELDYANSRDQILAEIMLILDVNAQVMGIYKDSNYNNSINAQRGWITQVLAPYADMVFNEPLKAFARKYYDPKLITVMEHAAEYDPETQLQRLEFYAKEKIVKKTIIAEMEGFSAQDVPEEQTAPENNL